MNHPHESQSAAMARAGELPDGEQLRECINSGPVSAAQAVAHQEAGEYGWRTECLKAEAALAAERADVARLREALEEIAFAGMSPSPEMSQNGVEAWHARQAWRFIGIAARALNPTQGATNHD